MQAEIGRQDVVRKLSRSARGAGGGGEGGVLPQQMPELPWGGVCREAPSRESGLHEVPHAGLAEQRRVASGGDGSPHPALSQYPAATAFAGERNDGSAFGCIPAARCSAGHDPGFRAGLGEFGTAQRRRSFAEGGGLSAESGAGTAGGSIAA